jgi:hypothetical protein
MKFNYKVALICFAPYIPIIALYLLVHVYISNTIIALLIATGIFSVLYVFFHYRYSKPFFKRHPELDPQRFEFNTVANIVFAINTIILMTLVIFDFFAKTPIGYLVIFGLYNATISGFKTYRGQTT